LGFRDELVEANVPKVDLQSYIVLCVGQIKSGKTRLWKELIEFLYPDEPEAGLLLAWEDGYKSWKLKSLVPLHKYVNAWLEFKTKIVPDLVKEAEGNPKTKLIGLDTVDRMYDACCTYILEKMSKKYAKNFTSIGEVGQVTKNADNAYNLVAEEITRELKKLKNAGYGLIELGWTKPIEEETVDGLKFSTLQMSLSKSARKPFESEADLICCLYPETKVLNKAGEELEENAVNSKGKEIASKFHSTEVNMYFRSNNYISISGGRFLNLPEKVAYSVENFMEVFENAVKGQLDFNDDYEEIKSVEIKEREESAKPVEEVKLEESITIEKSLEELISEIKAKGFELKDNKKPMTKVNKIIGNLKYKTVEEAQNVLDELNKL